LVSHGSFSQFLRYQTFARRPAAMSAM
jgi:hypothetical protein